MIEFYRTHPWVILLLAVLVIFTLWVCYKAAKAGSKRNAANEKTIKKIKEENELTNEFAILTETTIASADPERLFKGVALNLQKRVSEKSDIVAEFNSLTQEQKEVYSLYSVIDDGAEKLSAFFSVSTKPLTTEALNGFKRIFDGRAVEIFENEYLAYDSDDETTSFISEEIEKLDKEFSETVKTEEICRKAGEFIKTCPDKFI